MKSIRDFLSEITDIDSRLLKTFLQLFRNPSLVIEANLNKQSTYTKPLRYILFTSSVFIIWRFLFAEYVVGLFIEDFGIDDWWLPDRIARADSQFNNLFDTFFPFQILFFVVPATIILLKVFLIRKPWSELVYISLYSFGQFWMVMAVLVPVLVMYGFNIIGSMISFVLIGFCFRKLIAKNSWVAVGKWSIIGFLLIAWFYGVSIRITQLGLIQVTLPDRHNEVTKVVEPVNELLMSSDVGEDYISWPIRRDPNNRLLLVKQFSEGIRLECVQPDATVLWQTILPDVERVRKTFGVHLTSTEVGFMVLADVDVAQKLCRAILLSAKGKILFSKIYEEEMVLNGGDFVNGQMILTGGKSNGDGMVPFIDIIKLTFKPDSSAFEFSSEQTHFFSDVGHRFDDLHVLNTDKASTTLLVSKYETTKTSTSKVGAMDINRITVLKIIMDSIPSIVWEREIFHRISKYSPLKDPSFQMIYNPTNYQITAFYSVADQKRTSAYLFSIDTLGKIALQQKISANELTYLTDAFATTEGIYFCGSTEVGIGSPLLDFGKQGLIGFVSNEGHVSMANVGEDKQAHFLNFAKIIVNESMIVYDVKRTQNLFFAGRLDSYWRKLEFKRDILVQPNK